MLYHACASDKQTAQPLDASLLAGGELFLCHQTGLDQSKENLTDLRRALRVRPVKQTRIAVQLVGRTLVDKCAVIEHDNSIRHLRQLLGGVLDHDHGDRALSTQALDDLEDLVLANWIELRRWLIQDQDLRLADERIGDGQSLVLAARKTGGI